MAQHGIGNCSIEIIEDDFDSVGKLALAEIDYIKQYNSYRSGLNSTPGGDGLGKHELASLSENEISQIRLALSESFTEYNKNIKWANTTDAERKELTKHLHTEIVYEKKSNTLKKFYDANPEIKKEKSLNIQRWQLENQEQLRTTNKINGAKGAAKVSKKLVVEKLDKLLAIYPDYQAVYSYLTSPEAEIEIAQNPQKLDDIVKKINAFLLQYPIIQDANKFEDTPIINLSLKQVYKNTIQTAIDVINDISLIVSRKDSLTNAQLRRSIFRTLTSESRKLYVGIWLIFFSFVIYFIDSSV
jgi:hypothetical protein